MKAKPLAGLSILITRPKHQAESLSLMLKKLGAKTLLFPTLLIKPLHETPEIQTFLKKITHYNFAIFVSANAIIPLPAIDSLKIIAIGPGTANALKKNNIHVDFIPNLYNSEGILALPALQNIKNKSIAIFCGENSKPLLKDNLIQRGATVDEIVCYRRECPTITNNELKSLRSKPINLIITTSKESLQNLTKVFPLSSDQWIYKKHLLVISESMAELAHEMGFVSKVIIAKNATDQAIVDTLTNDVTRSQICVK